jgi:probable selenium-dependent hydroxylase accessory protein YqeC
VTDDPAGTIEPIEERPLGVVPEREREDRYLGYDPEAVSGLVSETDDPLLVKADGARMRWLKAPDEREPRPLLSADTGLPIASARVVGEPLTEERVHRPEWVAGIADMGVGEAIRPTDVAQVLTNPWGGLKDVPEEATVVPVVNTVDSDDLETVGRWLARYSIARAPMGARDRPSRGSFSRG